jgi:hypothetical protein
MPKKPLERFETLAQRWAERSLGRLFGGQLDPVEISADLARAIERNQQGGFAPNEFRVQLHPVDYSEMRTKWPDVSEILAHYVMQIARELRLQLATDPTVELVASPDIARHYAHIHAAHKAIVPEETAVFQPINAFDPLVMLRHRDAFLIVNGRRHVPLDKPQLTIGRRTDCDVVVEGKTVSRRHAQLRWRFGKFIIYDLGSRSGTYVNGERVNECVLRVGDLVQLADVKLIYGEGNAVVEADTAQNTQVHPRLEI